MKKRLLIIIPVLLLIIGIVSFILWDNRIVSYIIMDINPSIRINLDKNDKIKKIIALNKDAEKVIKGIAPKNLDEALEIITGNVARSEFVDSTGIVDVVLYTEGKVSSERVRGKIVDVIDKQHFASNIIVIDKITKEDKKLAKKYNISPSKAAYINSILKDKKIDVKNLVNKSVSELDDTKQTGYYCDADSILEGSWCLKEVSREAAPRGDICPNEYGDVDGTCYYEVAGKDGDKLICHNELKLEGNKCKIHDEYKARGKCSSGDYRDDIDKCVERKAVGDATLYCRITPGEDLEYNGRCLGRKPTINGGCLGNDVVIGGWCYDTSPNSGYEAEWRCDIDGQMILSSQQNSDGKCYKEVESDPTSYFCEGTGKLVDKKCIIDDIEDPELEKICPNGYTMINNRCYNLNKKADKVKGLYCEGPDVRMENNSCVHYERKEAKKA